jgi:hypothetical protein
LIFSKKCLKCTGIHIPPTFRDGTIPIDAIFATAGIEYVNAYILPHKGDLGDHRCFIVDFTSSSIIRTKFPNIIRCSAQKIHCKSTHLVQLYNARLDMLCNRHKMFQRIYFIYLHINCFSDDNFLYLMNNWDSELVQFKLHSETACTKFKMCHIEWSPKAGFWLSRQWLLARVRVFVMGLGPPDPRNPIRDCFHAHLCNPRYISHSDVMIQIKIAHCRLSELAKDAPALRCQHLLDLQKAADDWGHSFWLVIILEILTWEQEWKKWQWINNTTWSPQGGNPLSVRVQSGPITETYDTEDEVVGHTSNHLSKCFHLAYFAPCYCRKLFDDLGFTGDTECAQQILEGTYDFPLDTNIWTKKILQEAHYTFSHCLALRSQLSSQQMISKIFGGGSMKGHHLLLVGSLSCITRLLHQTRCCPQCTPRI